MRAIDLYSGIGGWAIGLDLAGVDTVASYEWWDQANRTHETNLASPVLQLDIRKLDLDLLPNGIDYVVGSPPCTQFSYSNRGGQGDIHEGLKDVRKFLEIVRHVRPKAWAMENVPRVAGILLRELQEGGELAEFSELVTFVGVLDGSEFGLPQRRKRMIAGNFDANLLLEYRAGMPTRTLGDVVHALSHDPIVDPVWGGVLPRSMVTDNHREAPLNQEELRMNRDAKLFHPVYNKMAFPDPLERTSRTVTATCTRVSRESIIVQDSDAPTDFRRLTVRERASLQGFPISYQLVAGTHAEKVKMVGNAIPPLLTFFVVNAMMGTDPRRMAAGLPSPAHVVLCIAPTTLPETPTMQYPASRRFRAAIPGLRFGSGVRFELANHVDRGEVSYSVDFYFGSSRDIRTVALGQETIEVLDPKQFSLSNRLDGAIDALMKTLQQTSPSRLQDAWTHRSGGVHPHQLADQMGETVGQMLHLVNPIDEKAMGEAAMRYLASNRVNSKLERQGPRLYVGLLLASHVNTWMTEPGSMAGIGDVA